MMQDRLAEKKKTDVGQPTIKECVVNDDERDFMIHLLMSFTLSFQPPSLYKNEGLWGTWEFKA